MTMVKAARKNIIESSLAPFQPGQTRIVSYSVPWPKVSLLAFLQKGQGMPRVYWESRQSATGLAGWGITAKLVAQGVNRFYTIQQEAEALFEELVRLNPYLPEGVGPRLVGGFAFDPAHLIEEVLVEHQRLGGRP